MLWLFSAANTLGIPDPIVNPLFEECYELDGCYYDGKGRFCSILASLLLFPKKYG